MVNNKYKEIFFLLILFLFILEYELIIVSSYFFDRIIKLGSLFIIILFYFRIKGNHHNYYIIKATKYFSIWLALLFISVLINLNAASVTNYFKYLLI